MTIIERQNCLLLWPAETFWTNPQYRVKIDKLNSECSEGDKNMLVSLMQKPDKRNRLLVKNLHIGISVFKVTTTLWCFCEDSLKSHMIGRKWFFFLFVFSWAHSPLTSPKVPEKVSNIWSSDPHTCSPTLLYCDLHKDVYSSSALQYKIFQGKFPIDFFLRSPAVAQTKTFMNAREVMELILLDPGDYLIVPSTFNPNETASFILTILSKAEAHIQWVPSS